MVEKLFFRHGQETTAPNMNNHLIFVIDHSTLMRSKNADGKSSLDMVLQMASLFVKADLCLVREYKARAQLSVVGVCDDMTAISWPLLEGSSEGDDQQPLLSWRTRDPHLSNTTNTLIDMKIGNEYDNLFQQFISAFDLSNSTFSRPCHGDPLSNSDEDLMRHFSTVDRYFGDLIPRILEIRRTQGKLKDSLTKASMFVDKLVRHSVQAGNRCAVFLALESSTQRTFNEGDLRLFLDKFTHLRRDHPESFGLHRIAVDFSNTNKANPRSAIALLEKEYGSHDQIHQCSYDFRLTPSVLRNFCSALVSLVANDVEHENRELCYKDLGNVLWWSRFGPESIVGARNLKERLMKEYNAKRIDFFTFQIMDEMRDESNPYHHFDRRMPPHDAFPDYLYAVVRLELILSLRKS